MNRTNSGIRPLRHTDAGPWLLALIAAAACDAQPGNGPDASADASCVTDTGTSGGADAPADLATLPTNAWATVVLTDKAKEANCKKTTAPGAEIDAIAVYRKEQLIGVVAAGSAVPIGTTQLTCPNNDFAKASAVEGAVDGSESKGVFALNGGGVEVAFAGCSAACWHVGNCDGKGPAVVLQPGDELDVYELDSWHMSNKLAASDKCTCTSDPYEVKVRRMAGSDEGAFVLGTFTGTTSRIKVP